MLAVSFYQSHQSPMTGVTFTLWIIGINGWGFQIRTPALSLSRWMVSLCVNLSFHWLGGSRSLNTWPHGCCSCVRSSGTHITKLNVNGFHECNWLCVPPIMRKSLVQYCGCLNNAAILHLVLLSQISKLIIHTYVDIFSYFVDTQVYFINSEKRKFSEKLYCYIFILSLLFFISIIHNVLICHALVLLVEVFHIIDTINGWTSMMNVSKWHVSRLTSRSL